MALATAALLSPKDREPLKCVNDPNFAVICSFLEQFAGLCAIDHPNFSSLQDMLENDEEVHADLIDLHVKLLRKLKFSVNVERWERSLSKFCYSYSTNDAWELERFAYKLVKLPVRLRILKNLLETQFDNNPKFKTAVNLLATSKLRPVALGRDKMGNVYWRTLDAECNIRIYQENQDEESLRIVASNRDELAKLIAVLSGKEPMTPNLAGLVDEDSSSNSDIVTAPVAEAPKDNIVQKDDDDGEEEEMPQTGLLTRLPDPSAASQSSSRITLLGKNNLDKINKFKLMNATKNEDESNGDDEEEEEDEDNYDDSDMDIEPEVGSIIQERVVYIRGEGAGKGNQAGNPFRSSTQEEDVVCGEAIEEPMMFFSGSGAGRECDVGNPGGEGDSGAMASSDERIETVEAAAVTVPVPKPLPKPMFFFGRPGCLKLSPMKVATPEESKANAVATGDAEKTPKPFSLVAYDDSNSAGSNSQDSQEEKEEDNAVYCNKKEAQKATEEPSVTSESVKKEEVDVEKVNNKNCEQVTASTSVQVENDEAKDAQVGEEGIEIASESVLPVATDEVDKVSVVNVPREEDQSVVTDLLPDASEQVGKSQSEAQGLVAIEEEPVEGNDIQMEEEKEPIKTPEHNSELIEPMEIETVAEDGVGPASPVFEHVKEADRGNAVPDVRLEEVEKEEQEMEESAPMEEEEEEQLLQQNISEEQVVVNNTATAIDNAMDQGGIKVGETDQQKGQEIRGIENCLEGDEEQSSRIELENEAPRHDESPLESNPIESDCPLVDKNEYFPKDDAVQSPPSAPLTPEIEVREDETTIERASSVQNVEQSVLVEEPVESAEEELRTVPNDEVVCAVEGIEATEGTKEELQVKDPEDEEVLDNKLEERTESPVMEEEEKDALIESPQQSEDPEVKEGDLVKIDEPETLNEVLIESSPNDKINENEIPAVDVESKVPQEKEEENAQLPTETEGISSGRETSLETKLPSPPNPLEAQIDEITETVKDVLSPTTSIADDCSGDAGASDEVNETVQVVEPEPEPVQEEPQLPQVDETVDQVTESETTPIEQPLASDDHCREEPSVDIVQEQAPVAVESTEEAVDLPATESVKIPSPVDMNCSPISQDDGFSLQASPKDVDEVMAEQVEESKESVDEDHQEEILVQKEISEPVEAPEPLKSEDDSMACDDHSLQASPKDVEATVDRVEEHEEGFAEQEDVSIPVPVETPALLKSEDHPMACDDQPAVEMPTESHSDENCVETPPSHNSIPETESQPAINEASIPEAEELKESVQVEDGKSEEEKTQQVEAPVEPSIEAPVEISIEAPVKPSIEAALPEKEPLSDNESDGDDGHFGDDFNDQMREEDNIPSESDEEVPESSQTVEAIVTQTAEPKTIEKEPEQEQQRIEEVPVVQSVSVDTQIDQVAVEKDSPADDPQIIVNEHQVVEPVPSPSPAEVPVAQAVSTLEDVPRQGGSDSLPPPQEPVPEQLPVAAPVEEAQQPIIISEATEAVTATITTTPPTKTRRGRRSDPVVAALGDTETITEDAPRTTRGRAANKESPKASQPPVKTPPQPRKNSRKRKASESELVAREEPSPVVTEAPTEVEVKEEAPVIQPQDIPNGEEPSAPVKLEQEPNPVKPDSDGDDEDEEEQEEESASKPAGRKAPIRGGKRGRRGRKAAPKKASPRPVDTEKQPEPLPIDTEIPVKEEPVPNTPIKEELKIIVPAETESPSTTEIPAATKPKKGRRQNRMMGLYMDEIQPQEDIGSVRQSRRIAQIKIKEETDRRLLEEVALVKMKDSMKRKPDSSSSADEDSGSEKGKGKGRGKKGKKPEKEKKAKTSWNSNSNTSDEEGDDKDEDEDNFGVMEEDPGSPLFKSDHEFSCESDVDGDEYVPTKMARTARKKKDEEAAEEEEEDNPDHACQKCGKHDHPEWILLCDTCDKGYHCSCLLPVLFIIPEGDWYCPQCQHAKLLEQLQLHLDELDVALAVREREAERLRRQAIHSICAENILPEDKVVAAAEEKAGRKSPGGGVDKDSNGEGSDDDEDEDRVSEDSDDMPIYKLRRRKQNKVSYRFNDYDELINKAIGHDMRDDRELDEIVQSVTRTEEGEGKAGNLGRGKDISTIMEADDNEKTRRELSQSDASGSEDEDGDDDDLPIGGRKRANVAEESDGSEVIRRGGGKNKGKKGSKGRKAGQRKKNRKLNNLDSSSDDDGSDEDFEGSSADDSEEEESGSLGSDSSMELAMYRKKDKRGATTRRSGRARVKRFDNDFINDNDDDDEDSNEKVKAPAPRKRKKKEESDFSDFDDDEDDEMDGSSDELEEQDLDSADLCDDSESEDSEDRPWGAQKKKKKSGAASTKVFSKNPIVSAGKVPRNPKRKTGEEEDDEKPFKASAVPKKKKKGISSDDDEEEEGGDATPAESSRPSRRTRGKKINFLEVVESGSSDDGIKPGVKRPDTPPEEREQFIKRQEEIKKMLAAKNTHAAMQAATPKLEPLKLKLSGANVSGAGRQDPNSLSTIPRNIIQSAKALDTEFVKARESGEEFDDELPEDFNPEDMDEEDLDRMMEEGDFGVQQPKMAGEAMRAKKQKAPKEEKGAAAGTGEKIKMGGGSLLEPLQPVSAQPPHELLANKAPPGYPLGHAMPPMMGPGGGPLEPIPHSVIQGLPPRGSHLPPPPHLIPDGQQPPHPMHQMNMGRMPLLPPNIMPPQGGSPGQLPVRFMHGGPGMPPGAVGPLSMPQNVIVGPRHNMQGGPSFPPYGAPSGLPPAAVAAAAAAQVPPPSGPNEPPKAVPKKRGRKPKEPQGVVVSPPAPIEAMGVAARDVGIPTTVLAHEASASPAKKGGRRKKITPSREELAAAAQVATAQAAATQAAALSSGKKGEPTEARGSILSERLEGGGDPKQTAVPPVTQNLAPQPPYSPSVIQRLPQPGGGPPSTMAGPYPGQGAPPRFYQHQGIGAPPNAAALGMHHMQPHGNERMHFMQQHPRHMPPHMYRPPTSIYANPYQGQHAPPPPHLQRPQMDPHGVRPMHPQDFSNSYLPPQFGPYIPGPHANPHLRGPTPSAVEDPKGKKVGGLPSGGPLPPGGPPPPHPSQLAHYEALKAAGGPMYAPPYPGGHAVPAMRHPGDQQGHPEAPNRGEFSGLVSYFSAQHDDLEQQ